MTEPATTQTPVKLREFGASVASRLVREHPTLVFTLAYVALTFVGMIHDLWFYFYFRINILDYSDTSDFLLAAIRNPLVIILSMLPIAILLGFQRLRQSAAKTSEWYSRHQAKYANTKWNSLGLRLFVYGWFVVVYAIVFTQIYSKWEAERIKKGVGRRVSYIRNDGIRSDEPAILLGTTSRFLFFYDPATKSTEIVPVESTTALRVDSRRRKEREQDSLSMTDSISPP